MRKYILVGLLCALAGFGHAQTPRRDSLGSVILLKVTPLALFDVDNTIQVGIELPLPNPAWTVQQEMGYGHSSFNLWYGEREQHPDRETWRFRSQIRYYFLKQNQRSLYLAGEYLFKKNSEERFDAVGMDCTFGQFGRQCAYFQNKNTHLGRFVNAFHFKFGGQFPIGERWFMDAYVGLGLRGLRVRYLGMDNNQQVDQDPGFFSLRTNRPGIYGPFGSASLGIHLGYRLGGKAAEL